MRSRGVIRARCALCKRRRLSLLARSLKGAALLRPQALASEFHRGHWGPAPAPGTVLWYLLYCICTEAVRRRGVRGAGPHELMAVNGGGGGT